MKYSVVIPVYKNEASIPRLLDVLDTMNQALEGRYGVRGAVQQPANGDLPVRLVADGESTPFVERVYRHRTFFSRLHHFVRLSSAFIVLPGGIGSTLEAMMVWQLLQAKHLPPTPFLLYGRHWRGLLDWIEGEALAQGYVDQEDILMLVEVATVDEAVLIILQTLNGLRAKEGNPSAEEP